MLPKNKLKRKTFDYGKGVFPWTASGRALGIGRSEGMTKILFDNKTHRVIGAAIVGVHAGDFISEIVWPLKWAAKRLI